MRCSDFSPLVFPSLSKEYLIKSESAGRHKRHNAAQRSFPLEASQLSHSRPEPAVHSRTFAQVRGRTHSQGETSRERGGRWRERERWVHEEGEKNNHVAHTEKISLIRTYRERRQVHLEQRVTSFWRLVLVAFLQDQIIHLFLPTGH